MMTQRRQRVSKVGSLSVMLASSSSCPKTVSQCPPDSAGTSSCTDRFCSWCTIGSASCYYSMLYSGNPRLKPSGTCQQRKSTTTLSGIQTCISFRQAHCTGHHSRWVAVRWSGPPAKAVGHCCNPTPPATTWPTITACRAETKIQAHAVWTSVFGYSDLAQSQFV